MWARVAVGPPSFDVHHSRPLWHQFINIQGGYKNNARWGGGAARLMWAELTPTEKFDAEEIVRLRERTHQIKHVPALYNLCPCYEWCAPVSCSTILLGGFVLTCCVCNSSQFRIFRNNKHKTSFKGAGDPPPAPPAPRTEPNATLADNCGTGFRGGCYDGTAVAPEGAQGPGPARARGRGARARARAGWRARGRNLPKSDVERSL